MPGRINNAFGGSRNPADSPPGSTDEEHEDSSQGQVKGGPEAVMNRPLIACLAITIGGCGTGGGVKEGPAGGGASTSPGETWQEPETNAAKEQDILKPRAGYFPDRRFQPLPG